MREKELRLALVCYGGISLAVYMHGITKEIWHLARASRNFLEDIQPDAPVAIAYAELLTELEAAGGVKLRVLPDIIAGASAGGINGIFLAQAIATGQSLEPLTELWLDKADVDELIDPEARPKSRFARLWAAPVAWALANRGSDPDDPEVAEKVARFVRSRWFEPPFGGETFTRLLLRAFDAMAAAPVETRLLPPQQPLDLFVTVTDFRGHPERLPLHSPPTIVETEHRLTLAFRDAVGEPDTIAEAAELVFAARATASFPGAFPPFTVAELDGVLAEEVRSWPSREAFLRQALPFYSEPGKAVLIDGSVLANAPFGPAIAALRNRPARRQVDRRFVYIDPKPGVRSVRLGGDGDGGVPGFITTLLGALSDLPREQPIRDNLEAIANRSAAIRRTRAVIEAIRPQVEAAIDALFGSLYFVDRPTAGRLAGWRKRADERAGRDAGHSNAAYLQLRLAELLGGLNEQLAELEVLGLARFLAVHDLAYRTRRLRFFTRRIAALREDRPELDPVLDVAYRLLATLADRAAGKIVTDLETLDADADLALATSLTGLSREGRRAALLAWLGFPFFDVATFALLQGEGLDEYDEIKVDRISPDDAQSVRAGDARATLKGLRFNSFGAFFSRAYRENDYLWGRLHGAERMVDIIASTVPDALSPAALARAKQRVFAAIFAEEAPRLTQIAPLIAELRRDLDLLAGQDERDGLVSDPHMQEPTA